MKTLGIILLVLGIIGTLYFGIQALNQSEGVEILGVQFAVSSANWTPVIISLVVLIVGIVVRVRK